jgi:hypothetical protein
MLSRFASSRSVVFIVISYRGRLESVHRAPEACDVLGPSFSHRANTSSIGKKCTVRGARCSVPFGSAKQRALRVRSSDPWSAVWSAVRRGHRTMTSVMCASEALRLERFPPSDLPPIEVCTPRSGEETWPRPSSPKLRADDGSPAIHTTVTPILPDVRNDVKFEWEEISL